jgi:hypothetical protein
MPDPNPTPPAPPAPPAPPTPPTPPAPPAPPTPPAPVTYTLKIPDGSPLDPAHLEKTVAYAKERGLSNEDAQKVLERDHANAVAYLETQKGMLVKKAEEWAASAKADKEIGGEAFAQNAELAKRVLSRFGTDDLRKVLDDTGYGNFPELMRFVVRIGKAMSEDQLVLPGAAPAGKQTPEQLFYPPKAPPSA